MDINELQALIDAGSLPEAIALVENFRLSIVELTATIEQNLADMRCGVKSVDWAAWKQGGEMDNLLNGAKDRIAQSQNVIYSAKAWVEEKIDAFEGIQTPSLSLEDPRREEYDKLRELRRKLHDCSMSLLDLMEPLIGANNVLFDELKRKGLLDPSSI
jgi:hypothetical protein